MNLNCILNSDFFITYRTEIYYMIETLIKIALFFGGVMNLAGLLTIGERKISALMQDRVGPNRAYILGFTLWGLFHPVADGIKMIMKEDFIPARANKFLFTIAPFVSLIPVLTTFAFIPFGNQIEIFGHLVKLQIADVDISLFLLIAVSSLAIWGTFLGGFASSNNWGILGALRAAAQMISYEVVVGLSLVPVIMIYSSASLSELVVKQGGTVLGFIPNWGIFLQPVSFLIFFTAALAENKRTPFDVVEGESEIIGYFIEYSSMRFGAFMFGEYVEIILFSMLASIFFFGGWQVPYLYSDGFHIFNTVIVLPSFIVSLLQILSFMLKTVFFSVLILMIRWTLPRFRFDQIMKLCWKYLLPLSILNIILTAVVLRYVK